MRDLASPAESRVALALVAETEVRATALKAQLLLALPHADVMSPEIADLADGALPEVQAAVIDAGAATQSSIEVLRLLRAHGFGGPIIVVAETPDDSMLRDATHSLGAVIAPRTAVDGSPLELASALMQAAAGNAAIAAEVAHARRVFAAGQIALSLHHSINNPLAALLAEAQLLQLEELTPEQRGSVDRMVELCRRIVALVRRLDALASTN